MVMKLQNGLLSATEITCYCYIMIDDTETLSFLKIQPGDVIPDITDLSVLSPFNHFNLASIDTRFTVLIFGR